jgi:hypothetical protein
MDGKARNGRRVARACGESGREGVGVGDCLLRFGSGGRGITMVAEDAEKEAEGGERVAGAEVRAEEARGDGGGEREAREEELRVRLKRGSAAEGR